MILICILIGQFSLNMLCTLLCLKCVWKILTWFFWFHKNVTFYFLSTLIIKCKQKISKFIYTYVVPLVFLIKLFYFIVWCCGMNKTVNYGPNSICCNNPTYKNLPTLCSNHEISCLWWTKANFLPILSLRMGRSCLNPKVLCLMKPIQTIASLHPISDFYIYVYLNIPLSPFLLLCSVHYVQISWTLV